MTSTAEQDRQGRRATVSLVHDPQACKAARIRAGLTGIEASKKIGISQSFLSEIERGVRSFVRRPHLLARMAVLYGVPTAELEARRVEP